MARKKSAPAPSVSQAISTLVDAVAATTPSPSAIVGGAPVAEMTRPTEATAEAIAAYGADYGKATPAPAKKSAPAKGSTFNRLDTISAVKANPKKSGSAAHARYARYKVGMSVSEALAAGLRQEDLRWDFARGFITLAPAKIPEPILE
jgi:hypothetical protein